MIHKQLIGIGKDLFGKKKKKRRRKYPQGLTHHQQHQWLESLERAERPKHRLGHAPIGIAPFQPTTMAQTAPSGPCDWGQRENPVTGQCEWFVGDQPGPEPGGVGGGQVVQGAWGLPAVVPDVKMRRVLKCERGLVLGIDNLCYPRAVLSSRNVHRKWRRPPKPTVSRRDEVAIRRAAAAKDRVLELAKDVGLHASKTRPAARKAKGHAHQIAAPVQTLRVISEETN